MPYRLKRQMLQGLSLVCAVAFLVFSAQNATCATSPQSITITDALGRSIEIRMPVKKVVAMNSDVVEMMRAMNAEDRLTGVFSEIVRERKFWGSLADKPKVGSWREADMEALAKIRPDLVIAYERNPGPELEKRLKPMGIQVLRLNFYKLKTMNREIRDLGRILGVEARAAELCAWYGGYFDLIEKRLKTVKKIPSVYVESYSDYHAAGPGSGGAEMCVMAGGRNLASEFSIAYPEVNPEWVVTRNPAIIIKAASWTNGYEKNGAEYLNQVKRKIMSRPAWAGISAVKSGRVHVMDSSIWTGPRAVVGVCHLARFFHPDLFKDINPESVHREYIERFQKIPFGGVFFSSLSEMPVFLNGYGKDVLSVLSQSHLSRFLKSGPPEGPPEAGLPIGTYL
ncbi:MAG: ABC transporter substrate-binding protein [Desulfobacteraceae bacterium]